jgi:hypothetical protein
METLINNQKNNKLLDEIRKLNPRYTINFLNDKNLIVIKNSRNIQIVSIEDTIKKLKANEYL